MKNSPNPNSDTPTYNFKVWFIGLFAILAIWWVGLLLTDSMEPTDAYVISRVLILAPIIFVMGWIAGLFKK